ncbi:putative NADPH dehydrogenase [Neolecta irregularis DAH-3]|uniref:Putative NADPH dehydrogenase n=1 Tax=Neolecta irregularis (strain DAH-3) TaxID=1198029 RepID=A0A1U7LH32_NEOID|nr:putative NADPH dehydrogenase [Neolecta irregularis DAH-3]|eukprot:OLL21957.1 putative NADPH dehydrogenase [Neolecta irregularis DAH-3]
MICDCLENIRSPDYSLYAPRQEPPAGTLLSQEESPILFHPIKIRSLNIHNRILVSPMCQYSAENGHMTDWHLVHYGSFAIQGPGLTMLECTSVTAAGRTNVGDSGLWVDSQIAPLKRIADFFHSQNQKLGIQLSHAGRKSSCLAPWMKLLTSAPVEAGGWPDQVIGPSNEPWNEDMAVPREMTIQDIQETTEAFARAAKRAIQASM